MADLTRHTKELYAALHDYSISLLETRKLADEYHSSLHTLERRMIRVTNALAQLDRRSLPKEITAEDMERYKHYGTSPKDYERDLSGRSKVLDAVHGITPTEHAQYESGPLGSMDKCIYEWCDENKAWIKKDSSKFCVTEQDQVPVERPSDVKPDFS